MCIYFCDAVDFILTRTRRMHLPLIRILTFCSKVSPESLVCAWMVNPCRNHTVIRLVFFIRSIKTNCQEKDRRFETTDFVTSSVSLMDR